MALLFLVKNGEIMGKLLLKNFALLAAICFSMTVLYASDSDSEPEGLVDEILGCKPAHVPTKPIAEMDTLSKHKCNDAKWTMIVKDGKANFTSYLGTVVDVTKEGARVAGRGCISDEKKAEIVNVILLSGIVLELNENLHEKLNALMSKRGKCECKGDSHQTGCHKHKK